MDYLSYNAEQFKKTAYYDLLNSATKQEFDIVSRVVHFKVNEYVLKELIDWDNIPADPIFKMSFPIKEMVLESDYQRLENQIASSAESEAPAQYAIDFARRRLFPTYNSAYDKYIKHPGVLHLFPKTLELFPRQASTCHSYCTYCHRWMPLVEKDSRFTYSDNELVTSYLDKHREVEDVIFSGGDPMVMTTESIKRSVLPLLDYPNIRSIRFATKSLAWWPYRYTSDPDSDELLEFFDSLTSRGINVTFIAHFTHPVELSTDVVKEAISKLQRSGVVMRCQGPVIKGVNDDPDTLAELWSRQVQLGLVPYYQFAEFNYGPANAFKIPVARLLKICHEAIQKSSGLVKTIRAPVISDNLMKACIEDIVDIAGEKYFALKCINSAKKEHVGRVFFEKYDPDAHRLSLDSIESVKEIHI